MLFNGDALKIFNFSDRTISSQQSVKDFVNNNFNKLFDFALNFCHGDKTAAEDAVQETYIKAIEKIDTLKKEESIFPWLVSIMRNNVVDCVRKRRKEILVDDFTKTDFPSVSTVSPEKEIIKKEGFPPDEITLRKFISLLPPDDIELFTVVCFQDMTFEEARKFFNTSPYLLRKRYFNAKDRLSKIMKDYYKKNGGII